MTHFEIFRGTCCSGQWRVWPQDRPNLDRIFQQRPEDPQHRNHGPLSMGTLRVRQNKFSPIFKTHVFHFWFLCSAAMTTLRAKGQSTRVRARDCKTVQSSNSRPPGSRASKWSKHHKEKSLWHIRAGKYFYKFCQHKNCVRFVNTSV